MKSHRKSPPNCEKHFFDDLIIDDFDMNETEQEDLRIKEVAELASDSTDSDIYEEEDYLKIRLKDVEEEPDFLRKRRMQRRFEKKLAI